MMTPVAENRTSAGSDRPTATSWRCAASSTTLASARAGRRARVTALRVLPLRDGANRFDGTGLIPAADRGHVAMVRALLETDIPIDRVNRLGWTALLEAVILGDGGPAHQEIVRLLVNAGADVRLGDLDGVTPLEHARRRGFGEIARLLE